MQRKKQDKLVLVKVPVTRPQQCGTMDTYLNSLCASSFPASVPAFYHFKTVYFIKSPVYKENASFSLFLSLSLSISSLPFSLPSPCLSVSLPFLILYEHFRGRAFVWAVRKCGKTRLQGRGESITRLEEWNSFSSLSKMILLAQGQRNLGLRMAQAGLATSLLRIGLRETCLCPVVSYFCICVLIFCF